MNKYFLFTFIFLELLLGTLFFFPVHRMCAQPAAWPDQTDTARLIFYLMAEDPRSCFQIGLNAVVIAMIMAAPILVIPAHLLAPIPRKIARLVKP